MNAVVTNKEQSKFHLSLFFSNNSGLNMWKKVGSLHREVAIYKRFVEHGWEVSFYTYDTTAKLPDIGFSAEIYSQWPYLLPKKLAFLYRQLLPFLFLHKGKQTDIILTNQAHSSGSSILAGRLWGAKVIARCGFVYGESAEQLGKRGRRVRRKIQEEKLTFEKSDKCIVPTQELEDWLSQNYKIARDKIAVIPNYVDIEQFKPDIGIRKDFDIICIGRLVAKKRHELLFEAMSGTQAKLHIIGNGRLKDRLRYLAKEKRLQVKMTERVENSLLPQDINRAKIYVNLAKWEGHPKGLIEAMACGCACIGTKSPGIKNLIVDGQTGMLVDPERQQIRNAINTVLEDEKLREHLGKNARDYAVEHFSLDKVCEQYKKVFEEVLAK